MIRKTIEIDESLAVVIQKMADDRIWSFSRMGYVLLQQAVKEKTRKRAKKDNTSDNSTNSRSSNAR